MKVKVCKNCGEGTIAIIKDLKSYDNHKVPVWYCAHCDLSEPVVRSERHRWTSAFSWHPPGFIYGNRVDNYKKCLGCNKDSMYADTDFLVNEAFPFYEAVHPSWVCYNCGFADKAVVEDKEEWANRYAQWRRG